MASLRALSCRISSGICNAALPMVLLAPLAEEEAGINELEEPSSLAVFAASLRPTKRLLGTLCGFGSSWMLPSGRGNVASESVILKVVQIYKRDIV